MKIPKELCKKMITKCKKAIKTAQHPEFFESRIKLYESELGIDHQEKL
jgi:hypothetical protein